MTDALRLVLYGFTSLALGFAVIVVPSAGFLFRDPGLYGITDGQYGLLFLPMVAATVGTGFAYQAIVARFGRRRVFNIGFVLTGLYLALVLAAALLPGRPAEVFALLMAGQALLGFGFALLMTSISVFSIELFPNHRTSVLTAIHAAFGVGALLAPLVLDLWSRVGLWQGQVVTGLAEVGFAATAAAFSRSVPEAEPGARVGSMDSKTPQAAASTAGVSDLAGGSGPSNPLAAFWHLPARAKGFILVLVLYGTVEAVVANWSTIYLTRDRGFSPTSAAICLSLFWGFLAAGRVAATFAAMRVEARHLFRAAPFVVTGGLILLNAVRTEAQIFVPYAVIGLGCSYTFPVSVSLTTRYHESRRDMLPSFMLAGLMTGVGLGSSAIGFITGAGFLSLDQIFGSAALAAAGLCVCFFFLTRPDSDRSNA